MTTAETVSVLAAGAAVVIVMALVIALVALTRTIKELRGLTVNLQESLQQVVPLAAELRGSLTEARGEIERLGSVTQRAENISATVDSASQLAYLAFSNPVIKTMAAGAGVTRAWRALRRNKAG